MNILYHHRTRGGRVERVHIQGIVNGLRKLGHKVEILSPPGVNIDGAKSGKIVSKSRLPLSSISKKTPEIIFELMELLYNVVAYFRMKTIYRRSKIDAIYERFFLFSLATALFARRARIPVILEINDASFVDRVRKLRMKRLAAIIERYTFSMADAIITVSSRLKDMIVSQGIAAEKIWVIPNAVDPNIFSIDVSCMPIREKYKLNGKTVIGFVGSMHPWHGLQALLDCACDLAQERSDICFLLVGDFENLSSASMDITRKLVGRVIFTGRIPHDQVPEYIAAMDIAVMPNSNSYGSPMKIFEYMAMGKATIAPDLPPLREVVRHGIDGLLIRPGDPEDMRTKILHLISNSQLREELGHSAMKSVTANYTWDMNSQRVAGILDRLYSKKPHV